MTPAKSFGGGGTITLLPGCLSGKHPPGSSNLCGEGTQLGIAPCVRAPEPPPSPSAGAPETSRGWVQKCPRAPLRPPSSTRSGPEGKQVRNSQLFRRLQKRMCMRLPSESGSSAGGPCPSRAGELADVPELGGEALRDDSCFLNQPSIRNQAWSSGRFLLPWEERPTHQHKPPNRCPGIPLAPG